MFMYVRAKPEICNLLLGRTIFYHLCKTSACQLTRCSWFLKKTSAFGLMIKNPQLGRWRLVMTLLSLPPQQNLPPAVVLRPPRRNHDRHVRKGTGGKLKSKAASLTMLSQDQVFRQKWPIVCAIQSWQNAIMQGT